MKIIRNLKAFTLIELLVVVGIIGILSGVILINFVQLMEKSREGATKGNIGAMKSAIYLYYGDNQGQWPGGLTDQFFQNYLASVPPVKIKHPNNMFIGGAQLSGTSTSVMIINSPNGNEAEPINGDGWLYNASTGNVFINNDQTDSSGLSYTMYGY